MRNNNTANLLKRAPVVTKISKKCGRKSNDKHCDHCNGDINKSAVIYIPPPTAKISKKCGGQNGDDNVDRALNKTSMMNVSPSTCVKREVTTEDERLRRNCKLYLFFLLP